MDFYLILIALILAYCVSIKAEDVDIEYDDYSQDKESYQFIEPTPTLTPTITNNEPMETEASMKTTVMTFEYTDRNFDVITTTMATDVDDSFITCSRNNKLATFGCDPHKTCYSKQDQFYHTLFRYEYTCGIYTHKTKDLIPSKTSSVLSFNPCYPTTYTYNYISSEMLYETKLYETINDEVITTTQRVYSYKSEKRTSTSCSKKKYSTFVYPQETILPYFAKVYGVEDEYVNLNLIIPKKRGFKIKKLDGYCTGGRNYDVTYTVPPCLCSTSPTVPTKRTTSPTVPTKRLLSSSTSKYTGNIIPTSSSGGFTGITIPSSSSSGFTGKMLPSTSTSRFTGKMLPSTSTSRFTGKTLPSTSTSRKIVTTPASNGISAKAISHYCNSNDECFGIHSSREYGGLYTYTCYIYTEEPSPTTEAPIRDYCQPTLSVSTRYYQDIKMSDSTIFNGDTMTILRNYLPRSTYSAYDTYTKCKTDAMTTEEESIITSTTESVIEPTTTITTEEELEITSTESVAEPTEKASECDPVTITFTEKEKLTITEQETVTVTVPISYNY